MIGFKNLQNFVEIQKLECNKYLAERSIELYRNAYRPVNLAIAKTIRNKTQLI